MQERKFYPWAVVFLLWFVALLNYLDRQMLSTMKPSMMLDIPELAKAGLEAPLEGELHIAMKDFKLYKGALLTHE